MLQNFGTALSREQMKMVVGGERTEDGGEEGATACTTNSDCAGITKNCGTYIATAVCNTTQKKCQTTCVS